MRRYRFSTQYTGPAQASQWQHALYQHVIREPVLCHADTRTREHESLGDLFTLAEAEGRVDPQVSRRRVWEAWCRFAEKTGYGWMLEYWDEGGLYWQYRLSDNPDENFTEYVRAEAHALGNLLKSHVGNDQRRHDLIHQALDYGLGWRGGK